MSKKIGYLRVSTKDQKTDRQHDGLKDICDELHVEYVSAVAKDRPVYKKVLRKLHAGDTLVVWDVDRAFRSTVDAINEAQRLLARKIHFQIVNLQVDTSRAHGMLIYTIISAIAEHERKFLIERTKEGIEAARKAGKRLGRPPKLSDDQLCSARERLEAGNITIAAIAQEYDVWPWTLSRSLHRANSPR